jgi:hypothetical protein
MAVVSLAIDPVSRDLQPLGEAALPASMAYVSTDAAGRFLLAASYPEHQLTVSPIAPDGTVGPVQQVLHTGPNAHAILPSPCKRYVLATALGGTVISWFVGIRLPGLEYNNQRTEAALRKDLVFAEDERSRMHLPTVLELFMGVRLNNFRLFNHYAYFHLWSNLYSQMMVIFPFLLMGPSLFTGLITLGVIQQVSNAFNKVNDAFSYLIERWTDITELRSIYKRLSEFEKALA